MMILMINCILEPHTEHHVPRSSWDAYKMSPHMYMELCLPYLSRSLKLSPVYVTGAYVFADR